MQPKIKRQMGLVAKGMAMGAADVVPGVSGGTVAFITGIYEQLIEFLGSVGKTQIFAFFLLFTGGSRQKKAWQELRSLNWAFFLPLVTGIIISILTLSKLIVLVMEKYPMQTYAFFFGLILFSVKFPFEEMKKDVTNYLIILICAVGAFAFFSISGDYQGDASNLPFVFLSGAIAICALILPGISGSTFLVILGMYKPIINAVHNRDLLTVGVFMAGMTVGILSFVRLLKWLLHNYHSYTMAGLTGLMIGSLKKVWPLNYTNESTLQASEWLFLAAFVLFGVAIVFLLEKFAKPMKVESTPVA